MKGINQMQKMDFDRLAQWKCLYCGSRKKDVADMIGKDGEIVAKVITCCHCGHTNIFAHSARSVVGLLVNSFTMAREGMNEVPTHINEHPELKETKDPLHYVVNPIKTNI